MRRRSNHTKLKELAAEGNAWALAVLAKAQAAKPTTDALADARDIREWTDGPNVESWRIYRLAQVLQQQ